MISRFAARQAIDHPVQERVTFRVDIRPLVRHVEEGRADPADQIRPSHTAEEYRRRHLEFGRKRRM